MLYCRERKNYSLILYVERISRKNVVEIIIYYILFVQTSPKSHLAPPNVWTLEVGVEGRVEVERYSLAGGVGSASVRGGVFGGG